MNTLSFETILLDARDKLASSGKSVWLDEDRTIRDLFVVDRKAPSNEFKQYLIDHGIVRGTLTDLMGAWWKQLRQAAEVKALGGKPDLVDFWQACSNAYDRLSVAPPMAVAAPAPSPPNTVPIPAPAAPNPFLSPRSKLDPFHTYASMIGRFYGHCLSSPYPLPTTQTSPGGFSDRTHKDARVSDNLPARTGSNILSATNSIEEIVPANATTSLAPAKIRASARDPVTICCFRCGSLSHRGVHCAATHMALDTSQQVKVDYDPKSTIRKIVIRDDPENRAICFTFACYQTTDGSVCLGNATCTNIHLGPLCLTESTIWECPLNQALHEGYTTIGSSKSNGKGRAVDNRPDATFGPSLPFKRVWSTTVPPARPKRGPARPGTVSTAGLSGARPVSPSPQPIFPAQPLTPRRANLHLSPPVHQQIPTRLHLPLAPIPESFDSPPTSSTKEFGPVHFDDLVSSKGRSYETALVNNAAVSPNSVSSSPIGPRKSKRLPGTTYQLADKRAILWHRERNSPIQLKEPLRFPLDDPAYQAARDAPIVLPSIVRIASLDQRYPHAVHSSIQVRPGYTGTINLSNFFVPIADVHQQRCRRILEFTKSEPSATALASARTSHAAWWKGRIDDINKLHSKHELDIKRHWNFAANRIVQPPDGLPTVSRLHLQAHYPPWVLDDCLMNLQVHGGRFLRHTGMKPPQMTGSFRLSALNSLNVYFKVDTSQNNIMTSDGSKYPNACKKQFYEWALSDLQSRIETGSGRVEAWFGKANESIVQHLANFWSHLEEGNFVYQWILNLLQPHRWETGLPSVDLIAANQYALDHNGRISPDVNPLKYLGRDPPNRRPVKLGFYLFSSTKHDLGTIIMTLPHMATSALRVSKLELAVQLDLGMSLMTHLCDRTFWSGSVSPPPWQAYQSLSIEHIGGRQLFTSSLVEDGKALDQRHQISVDALPEMLIDILEDCSMEPVLDSRRGHRGVRVTATDQPFTQLDFMLKSRAGQAAVSQGKMPVYKETQATLQQQSNARAKAAAAVRTKTVVGASYKSICLCGIEYQWTSYYTGKANMKLVAASKTGLHRATPRVALKQTCLMGIPLDDGLRSNALETFKPLTSQRKATVEKAVEDYRSAQAGCSRST